jgi:patatin-like phospholipase/acyl hydrolase
MSAIARATTAAPPFFKAKEIEEKNFVDGAFGHNNPAFLAYQEVDQKHKHEAAVRDPSSTHNTAFHFKNVISIGTGRAKTSRLVGPAGIARYRNWFRHAAHQATDTTAVESIMSHNAREIEGLFYKRFTVTEGLGDIGLDEWKTKKGEAGRIRYVTLEFIEQKTRKYLENENVRRSIEASARAIYDAVQRRQHPSYPNAFPFPGPEPCPPLASQSDAVPL